MNRTLRLSLVCLGLPLAMAISNCGDGLDSSTPSSPTGSSSGELHQHPDPHRHSHADSDRDPDRPRASCPSTDCGASCCFEGGGNPYVAVIDDAQAELEHTRKDIFNSDGSLNVDEVTYTNILAEKIHGHDRYLRGRRRPGFVAQSRG